MVLRLGRVEDLRALALLDRRAFERLDVAAQEQSEPDYFGEEKPRVVLRRG